MDLIDENDEPTEACMAREESIWIQYQKAFSHCEVDQQFYCAQLVDSNRWYHIVIERVGEMHTPLIGFIVFSSLG